MKIIVKIGIINGDDCRINTRIERNIAEDEELSHLAITLNDALDVYPRPFCVLAEALVSLLDDSNAAVIYMPKKEAEDLQRACKAYLGAWKKLDDNLSKEAIAMFGDKS